MTIFEAFAQAESLAKQNPPTTIVLSAEMHLMLNIGHDFPTAF